MNLETYTVTKWDKSFHNVVGQILDVMGQTNGQEDKFMMLLYLIHINIKVTQHAAEWSNGSKYSKP